MTQVELSWYEEVMQRGEAEWLAKGKAEGLAKGKAEGLAEGKAEGLAEGKAEGKAESLIMLLERRVGHLSEENLQRIRNASLSQLENWLDRAVDGDNLNGILAT